MTHCDDVPESRLGSSSLACTLRMTDPTQRTLEEFAGDDVDRETDTDTPTETSPEENAADIQRLADLVEGLTRQVGEVVDELEQQQTASTSIDTEPTDETRMFH